MSASATLATLPIGARGEVSALRLTARDADWLRAVGLREGVEVVVLRRAPFGGPLHVRSGSAAELAIDRGLAGLIDITIRGAP